MVNILVAIAIVDLIVMTNTMTNVLRACVGHSCKLFVLKLHEQRAVQVQNSPLISLDSV